MDIRAYRSLRVIYCKYNVSRREVVSIMEMNVVAKRKDKSYVIIRSPTRREGGPICGGTNVIVYKSVMKHSEILV